MFIHSITRLNKRFLDAVEQTENQDDDYEQIVYDLEKDVKEELKSVEDYIYSHPKYGFIPDEQIPNWKDISELESLLKKITHLKNENDFYDAEDMSDMMFPNRFDEDFDEDSLSNDSAYEDD